MLSMLNFLKKYKTPLRFVFDSLWKHKKIFYLFIFWKFIEAFFYILLPIFAKIEMDQLVEKKPDLFWFITLNSFNIFLLILGLIFFIKFLENILRSLLELFTFNYIKIFENSYLYTLYTRLWNIELWLFLNKRNKRLVSNILWSSHDVWNWIRVYIWDLLSNIIFIIWTLTVFSFFSFYVLLVLLISSVIIYFLYKYKEILNLKYEVSQNYEFEDRLNQLKYEIQDNLHILSSNSWEKLLFKYLKQYNDEQRKLIYKLQKKETFISLFTFFIENIWELFIKLIIWFSIFAWTSSVWLMTMGLLYVSKINWVFSYFREFKFYSDSILDNLSKLDLFLSLTRQKSSRNTNLNDFSSIELKNVTFKYPSVSEQELKFFKIIEDRINSYKGKLSEYNEEELHMVKEAIEMWKQENKEVLKWIDLYFEKWKVYWIVWRNWSWKTTITNLILSFFSNYTWNINIGDIENSKIKRDSIMKKVSIVNQIPYVLNGFSVRENLLLGVIKKYDDDYIFNLLDKFWLKNKILKLRKWIDTIIWYDSDFSGWEKQLLAIIRVILQDKDVLIMDEWTNQLDAENELLVMSELLRKKKDKIIIFITHRMTTIRKADMIYCLEDWKITISWKHHDLLKWKNIYNDFWNKQVVN